MFRRRFPHDRHQQASIVNPLLAQLFALERAEGVASEAMDEVLRLLAACLVQQNPAAGAGSADPGFSQALTQQQFDALVLGLPWQRLTQMQVITRM